MKVFVAILLILVVQLNLGLVSVLFGAKEFEIGLPPLFTITFHKQ